MPHRPSFPLLIAGLALAGACAAGPASAQRLGSVSVSPRTAAVGQPVTITAQFDTGGGLNCAALAHFGDGRTQPFKVNQQKDARFELQHRYDKPGEYTVLIEPKTDLPVLRCLGDAQRTTVTIKPGR